MAIGCELHPIGWWDQATERDIAELDGKKAVEYWRKAKPILFDLIAGCDFWERGATQ